METIAFRIWDKERKKFWDSGSTPTMLSSFFDFTKVLHTKYEMPYQQYTGLSDKNKVWIYEGDIVINKNNFSGSGNKAEVKYAVGNCGYVLRRKDGVVLGSPTDWENIEVIGNIYENPELLNLNKK